MQSSDRKDMIHDLMRLIFSVIASIMNILCEGCDEKTIRTIIIAISMHKLLYASISCEIIIC